MSYNNSLYNSLFNVICLVSIAGVDPGFFKRGGAQIKDWQNLGACGDGGVWGGCAPSEAEKNCNF